MLQRQRKIRNYLLDRRFQLKYTGMVLLVTLSVASVLGSIAYQYSKDQTEALTAQLAVLPEMDPVTFDDLSAMAAEEDRRVARGIVIGVLALVLALGLTGIIVTHRVVGPAYRMRRLFEEVSDGKLKLTTGIRKGDELQDLYRSFADMVDNLRDERTGEIERLEQTLKSMEAAGMQSEYITHLRDVVDRLRKSMD